MRFVSLLPAMALVLASLSFASLSSGLAQTAVPEVSPPEAPDAPAVSQAAPKAKAAMAAQKNATEVVVSNARTVALTGLSINNGEGKAITTLKKPLEPGKKISLKLAAKAGCTFVVNASFADEAEFEETQVDLCADKNLRFKEGAGD